MNDSANCGIMVLAKPVMFLVFASVLLLSSFQARAMERLHGQWSSLLTRHVVDGHVNYQGMKNDIDDLNAYLGLLNRTNPAEMDSKDRLAYYINAYNACTVKLIVDNFKGGEPVSSIKDIGGFFSSPWKISFCGIHEKELTLDEIEHGIIRKQFKEPRVHFAVNCASESCPPLIPEAYEGAILDSQLEKNTIAFINDQRHNYIEGNSLYISKIFKWFPEDFDDDIVDFIYRFATPPLRDQMHRAGDNLNVKYLDYDWSINALQK